MGHGQYVAVLRVAQEKGGKHRGGSVLTLLLNIVYLYNNH